MSKSPMPLPQIRRRTSQQATRRAKRCSREIDQENSVTRNDPANQVSSRIQNSRTTLVEANFKPLIKKLRNREQIKTKIRNQNNLSQGEAIRNSNSANTTYLALTIIPKYDVFFVAHWGEAGEPFVIPGHMARTTGVHDPPVLQASNLHISSETKGEQMSQHWG